MGLEVKPYWLVAYGSQMKVSSRTYDSDKAIKETFGNRKCSVLKLWGKKWASRSKRNRQICVKQLEVIHGKPIEAL